MNSKSFSFINVVKFIFPLAFFACPVYFSISVLIGVLHGLSHGFITISTQHLFDAFSLSNAGIKLFEPVLILGISLVFNNLINGAHNIISEDVSKKIINDITYKFHIKSSKIDPILFEDSEILDRFTKAKEGIENSAFFLFVLSMLLTYYLPYFIFMGVYLYLLRPLLIVSLVCIFIPVIFNQLIKVKMFTHLSNDIANSKRRYEYYEKCIVGKEYFKETRILNESNYFKKLFLSSLNENSRLIWKAEKKSGLIELLMKSITLIGYVMVLLLLYDSLIKGFITVGSFFAVFSSINMMFKVMEEIVCNHMGKLSRNHGSIKNLMIFMNTTEFEIKENSDSHFDSIELKNVSFKYPNTSANVLKNLNFKIEKGETIAIVGENGAGKSTLVNIISGIYAPSEGNVIINGKISRAERLNMTSAVLQNFIKYKMNFYDNVLISDVESDDNDHSRIQQLLYDSGLPKDKYDKSFEEILSRDFGGLELSGGDWQKIAIARGLYRKSKIMILDEPTASIDPIEETKLLNQFIEIANDYTTILVTHRLGSVKYADKILVMKDGEIIDIGSHDFLMSHSKYYVELYNSQKLMYDFTC